LKEEQTDKPVKKMNLEKQSFGQLMTPEIPTIQTNQEPAPQLKEIIKFTETDLKILEALVFAELRNEPEVALGLVAEIMNKDRSPQVLYYYAKMSLKVGLNIEYRTKMLEIIKGKKSGDWLKIALNEVMKNPNTLEVEDIGVVDPQLEALNRDFTEALSYYQLLRGKFYNRSGDLDLAAKALQKVDTKSKEYAESLFLQSVIFYKRGQLELAITEMEKMMDTYSTGDRENLKSLAAVTLGRMYFQNGEYKKSFEAYGKVYRNHALWFEATSEQAWSQIMIQDYEGAAGNMFSLHTDYFKNVYNPESYAIRTVSYLNLCQFGDGTKVLQELNRRYSPIKAKVAKFKNEKIDPLQVYEHLKFWLRNPDLKEVEGWPASFLIQMGRDPEFITAQKRINQREDEITQFNKLFLDLLKEQKSVVQGDNKELQAIYKQARGSLKFAKHNMVQSLNQEILGLKNQGAKALTVRAQKMISQLDKIMDDHELLAYELYAGAGEHLRYQSAGGDISKKERPELKGAKDKSMTWKFKGEIWEDEIGHYRSALKNVCADQDDRGVASEKKN
ncbi:MAG: tetratricopeptide repeat protein, partial [Pseudobdellovibrionaceae bacterium]